MNKAALLTAPEQQALCSLTQTTGVFSAKHWDLTESPPNWVQKASPDFSQEKESVNLWNRKEHLGLSLDLDLQELVASKEHTKAPLIHSAESYIIKSILLPTSSCSSLCHFLFNSLRSNDGILKNFLIVCWDFTSNGGFALPRCFPFLVAISGLF